MRQGRNPAFRNIQYSHERSLEIALLLWEESHMHYIHKKLQSKKKIPSNKHSYRTSCVATFQLINPGTETGNLSGTSGTAAPNQARGNCCSKQWKTKERKKRSCGLGQSQTTDLEVTLRAPAGRQRHFCLNCSCHVQPPARRKPWQQRDHLPLTKPWPS